MRIFTAIILAAANAFFAVSYSSLTVLLHSRARLRRMQSRRRTTIIVVGGALAVASVGYGLGTQVGDGTAIAGSDQGSDSDSRRGGPPAFGEMRQPPGFRDLAGKLGVSTSELANAFRAFHESEDGDRRDEFAAALAKALGISTDRVSAAFEQLHQRHEGRFAARLADALNVDADKVEAALDKLKGDTPRRPEDFAQALADELGVGVTDVRRALFEARPVRGRMHREHAMPLRQLASALGVSRADLRAALSELRAGAENRWEEHNQALAKFLADRFDLSADDVARALDQLPRQIPQRHGDRPGPGGPGPAPAFGGPA
jgi:transcriptional regulator with XRE-family HTH domain